MNTAQFCICRGIELDMMESCDINLFTKHFEVKRERHWKNNGIRYQLIIKKITKDAMFRYNSCGNY